MLYGAFKLVDWKLQMGDKERSLMSGGTETRSNSYVPLGLLHPSSAAFFSKDKMNDDTILRHTQGHWPSTYPGSTFTFVIFNSTMTMSE